MPVRVALLSSIESFAGGERQLRAFARIGGRTVLERQLDFAIETGCDQIACLSDGLHPELIDLQHRAEDAGVRFQIIRDNKPLSGLVKAADDVLVLSDGLVFDEELARGKLASGRIILTLPAERAIPAGFERLDRDLAWAGLMLISGALVEQLADLPSDVDPQSSMLRLALQSGTKTNVLPDAVLTDHNWLVASDADALEGFEARWLGRNAKQAGLAAPVSAAADKAAFAVLKRHTNPAKAARAVGGLSYAMMGIAVLTGYFGYPLIGVALATIGAFAARFNHSIFVALSKGREMVKVDRLLAKLPPVFMDIVLVMLVAISAVPVERYSAAFAAIMLIGLVRLGAAQEGFLVPVQLRDLFEDRGVLAVVLGLSLAFNQLIPVLQIVAAVSLVYLLYQTYSSRITRA